MANLTEQRRGSRQAKNLTLLLSTLLLLLPASPAYAPKAFPKKILPSGQTSPAVGADKSNGPSGTLFVDLPWKVELNKPFRMDVWFVSGENGSTTPADVFMDLSEKVAYEPDHLTLPPKVRQQSTVTVTKSPSGLAEIMVTSECCDDISMSLDTGFKGRLKWRAPTAVESRSVQPATIEIVDSQDRPLPLDAPVHFRLTSSNAAIRIADGKWGDTLEFVLRDGETATPAFYVRPTPLDASTGSIQVTGFLNDDSYTVLKSNLDFDITPPWWLRLGMAALGGVIFSAYRTFRRGGQWSAARAVKPLWVGALAGGFAYAIADWDVLGIKTDTTHLRAFVVLGLMVSYIGIEPLLAVVAKRLKGNDEAEAKPVNETPTRIADRSDGAEKDSDK